MDYGAAVRLHMGYSKNEKKVLIYPAEHTLCTSDILQVFIKLNTCSYLAVDKMTP